LRLRSFPFDRQTFRVQLVAVRYQSNEVMFVPDQVWIRHGLKGAGGIGQKKKRAKRIDSSCRAVFPAVFLLASIVIFLPPRRLIRTEASTG
jgi:hypothetical protein